MRPWLGVMAFSIVSTGCQSIQLENHTRRQAAALTDLEYRQVLDNLAMLHTNPAALPYYSAPGTGQTQTQQSANAGTAAGWDLLRVDRNWVWHFDRVGPSLGASET